MAFEEYDDLLETGSVVGNYLAALPNNPSNYQYIVTTSNSTGSGSVVMSNSPYWTNGPIIDAAPLITLSKSKSDYKHYLEKVEDKKWKVIHLTFTDLIDLQTAGVKYTWLRSKNDIFLCFDSDADESQAIMIVGNAPYDE